MNIKFKPTLTPEQMFKKGIFGRSYFRNIYCTKNKKFISHNNEFPFCKENSNNVYNAKENYYGIKCGTNLEFWQEKNWINPIDPYGWVQWYCRYFNGRRCADDERQINRWINAVSVEKGRMYRALRRYPNSLKYKQILLHWAVDPEI